MGLTDYFRNKPTTGVNKTEGRQVENQSQLLHPPRLAALIGNSSSNVGSVTATFVDDIKHEVMVNYLFRQQAVMLWADIMDTNSHHGIPGVSGFEEGVLLRKSKGCYLACPSKLAGGTLAHVCTALNIQVAMTVNSPVIKTILQWSPDAADIPLSNGLRIPILPTLTDLPLARKYQFAAFIADSSLLVIWDDDALNIIGRAKRIENELMELVWRSPSTDRDDEGKAAGLSQASMENIFIPRESGEHRYRERRPTVLVNTILVAFTLTLVLAMLGAGWRQIAIETAVDRNYLRMAFIALAPIQVVFTLVIVGSVAQLIGPISQLTVNSKYYSANPPPRIRTPTLPHVTIQCPVYKEGLEAVIAPTIKSIEQAISTYELQGGTANIFINDDGMQLLTPEERLARTKFYSDHNIGWVARPKHGEDGFLRQGKFKKASNMNYALMISCSIEEKLADVERGNSWTQAQEVQAYERCLKEVLEENGKAWAAGNVRVGDYILLIDSDTRVPSDCLLDAAYEMERSPEVGILQFNSGVMQVANHYFENGIAFFTKLVYAAIRYTVANGDVAPFVGHNAILRWSAIQHVSYMDEDGYEKYWSELHVSEDFDMSLRLQCNGYTIRLAAYTGDGFKEGVSLTVYDELARWEKYAYGCNELLFHPLRFWLVRGPFTPLFRKFLFSKIPMASKISIISYIGTYYAIGAAWIMTTVNYFAVGWFDGYLDKYYIDSWKVWFSIVIVFNLLGNVSFAAMHFRTSEKNFFDALIENCKWIFLLAVFLGGLSLHVSQALLSHMFDVDMCWSSTSKEVEESNFFIEVSKVLHKFKLLFTFGSLTIAVMVVLATGTGLIPDSMIIRDFEAILPLATVVGSHMLLPIVLNPVLMMIQC